MSKCVSVVRGIMCCLKLSINSISALKYFFECGAASCRVWWMLAAHRTWCSAVHQMSLWLAVCFVIAYLRDAALLFLAPTVCYALQAVRTLQSIPFNNLTLYTWTTHGLTYNIHTDVHVCMHTYKLTHTYIHTSSAIFSKENTFRYA